MFKDTLSRIAVGMLIFGIALTVFSAVDFGPTIDESSALGWWAFGIGMLLTFAAGIVYIVAISFRATSWPEVGLTAVIAVLFFTGYIVWLKPIKGDAFIFHPAMGTAFLAATWLAVTIYCGFRASKSS